MKGKGRSAEGLRRGESGILSKKLLSGGSTTQGLLTNPCNMKNTHLRKQPKK